MSNYWTPIKEWEYQDVFLIGGGSSLKDFDFKRLRGKHTIGANEAHRLGSDIIRICAFCDSKWFHTQKFALEKFTGRVVTDAPTLINLYLPWLLRLKREVHGLHSGDSIGFNYSTGAMMINLALNLGASRVFLLGYDLASNKEGQSHWHNHYKVITREPSYLRFEKGFKTVFESLKGFTNVPVINVTDGSSNLQNFPRMTFDKFQEVL